MDNNIRKSIKRISLEEPKTVHIKVLVIYLLILSLVSYFIMNFINDNNLVVLFSFIITMPLYLNFIKLCLDCSRDVLIDFKDLFVIKKHSFKFSLYYGLLILILYLINGAFNLMGAFGEVISIVIIIYLIPILIMMPFVFLDNYDLSFKDFVVEPIKLMNKKRITFYGLLCSFILWFLLGFITLGILYLWLIPYIMICIAYFYLSLKGEKIFKKEKNLSNVVIVVLFLIFVIGMNIVSISVYPDSFNVFKESLNIK